jgi:benzoyl-CoA reductase/2-hydroxyglutaryl-CoA dehydratase subunit BcrC/BadD/HgdB
MQLKPKVKTWEGFAGTREWLEDILKVNIVAPDRVDGAFFEVCYKTSYVPKHFFLSHKYSRGSPHCWYINLNKVNCTERKGKDYSLQGIVSAMSRHCTVYLPSLSNVSTILLVAHAIVH